MYGPPTGKKDKEKFPEDPTVVVFVKPVGVNSASTVAPATLTEPLREEVVSTSEIAGKLRRERINNKEKRLDTLFTNLAIKVPNNYI